MSGALISAVSVAILVGATQSNGSVSREGNWSVLAPSVLGLAAVQSTFADVKSVLGAAPESKVRGAANPRILCYRSDRRADHTVLVFESSGAGGFGRSVTGFTLRSMAPAGNRASCRRSPRVTQNVVLSNGLRLGISRKEASTLIGRSIPPHEASVLYSEEYDTQGYVGEDVERRLKHLYGYAALTLTFQGDVLIAIGVAHTVVQ